MWLIVNAAWSECVINRNATPNTSILSSDIVTLVHEIGGKDLRLSAKLVLIK